MKYEIQERQDLSGISLVIRFPSEEFDKKAVYTLQENWPDFVVPFRCRNVNGMTECTYLPGATGSLHYYLGYLEKRQPMEYVNFWEAVLQPLLDCRDWFLNPFSFCMDHQNMFFDAVKNRVSYLYIPIKSEYSNYEDLRQLVCQLSEKVTCSDSLLETKVLRAIVPQNFNPEAFLQMIRASVGTASKYDGTPGPEAPVQEGSEVWSSFQPMEESHSQSSANDSAPKKADDPSDIFGGISQKVVEDVQRKKNVGWLQKKKEKSAGKTQKIKMDKNEKEKKDGGRQGKSGKGSNQRQESYPDGGDIYPAKDGGTIIKEAVSVTCLRLTRNNKMPKEIVVNIQPGETYTVGRHDKSLDYMQSNFEFPENTVAVSRRHAAIERGSDGRYIIVDLTSKAGTYINGEKLVPFVKHPLVNGDRVSFGTSGADYQWEQ